MYVVAVICRPGVKFKSSVEEFPMGHRIGRLRELAPFVAGLSLLKRSRDDLRKSPVKVGIALLDAGNQRRRI